MEVFSGKCRKHPSSNRQPGICSLCLRDRLQQLADAYNHNTTLFHNYNYTDGADRRLSSSTSTSSSPPANKKKHVRHASSSDAVRSISYVVGEGGELKKSRSIATTMMSSNKRGGSIWKKLLRVRGMDQVQVVLGKSRTVKDRFDV